MKRRRFWSAEWMRATVGTVEGRRPVDRKVGENALSRFEKLLALMAECTMSLA